MGNNGRGSHFQSSIVGDSSSLPIAIDATGGDHGLGVVVEGAVQAFQEFGIRSILVGPDSEVREKLQSIGASQLPLGLVHAPETIQMDESPTRAVRRKPNSSLCVAYRLLQDGKASAIISAGNSGAMMAAGRLICGILPGIERPAIAAIIPTPGDNPPNVMLDTGANVDCDAHNLIQFAIMGSNYWTSLTGIERPRVGLLSNGTETTKGTDVIRAAASMLLQVPSVNYIGFVEGRDIPTTAANVIVCDGFVGNVVLKALEGAVKLIGTEIRLEAQKSFLYSLGAWINRPLLRRVFSEKFDYSSYGGAPLLGLPKLAVVLHGASKSRAVKNALKTTASFLERRMVERITSELSQFEDNSPDMAADPFAAVVENRKGEIKSSSQNGALVHQSPSRDEQSIDSGEEL